MSPARTLEEELQVVPSHTEESFFHLGYACRSYYRIFLADSYVNSWVFDTGSVAHICNSMQGMTKSRSVERGEVDFRVGNNARVTTLAVGAMQLHLPSGFVLELNSCYFVSSLS